MRFIQLYHRGWDQHYNLPSDLRLQCGDIDQPAAALIRDLKAEHGPLMFHQSGGCCDGSAPMCYPDGEFLTGPADVHLGVLDVGLDRPVPVFGLPILYDYVFADWITLIGLITWIIEGR